MGEMNKRLKHENAKACPGGEAVVRTVAPGFEPGETECI
jgi:hypothetical protein